MIRWWRAHFSFGRWHIIYVRPLYSITQIGIRNVHSGKVKQITKQGLWSKEDFWSGIYK